MHIDGAFSAGCLASLGNVVIGLLGGILVGCGGPLPVGDPARPDVILISVDSLRPDHLGAYGYSRPTSPFLDRLANEGTRYEKVWSASPWTLPAHVTMLSGRGPLEHEVVEDDRRIPDDLPLLAEVMHAGGFATAGFVSAVYVSKQYGFDRGFDHFEDYGITERENLRKPTSAERVVGDALDWVKSEPGKPVFLFVHLYDVHYPYLPPEPFNSKFDKAGTKKSTHYQKYQTYLRDPIPAPRMAHLIAQYDESIAYVDAQLERLYRAFEDSKRDAVFVVTADHGEEFGERGSWGHAHTLYPEVMRVPLIVGGVGKAKGWSRVVSRDVAAASVAATVASRGIGVDGSRLGGVVLDGETEPGALRVLMETSRFDTAKLGLLTASGGGSERVEMDFGGNRSMAFAHASDPGENRGNQTTEAQLADLLGSVEEQFSAIGAVTSAGWMWDGSYQIVHGLQAGEFSIFPADSVVSGPAERKRKLPPTAELSAQTKEQLDALGYQQ